VEPISGKYFCSLVQKIQSADMLTLVINTTVFDGRDNCYQTLMANYGLTILLW